MLPNINNSIDKSSENENIRKLKSCYESLEINELAINYIIFERVFFY